MRRPTSHQVRAAQSPQRGEVRRGCAWRPVGSFLANLWHAVGDRLHPDKQGRRAQSCRVEARLWELSSPIPQGRPCGWPPAAAVLGRQRDDGYRGTGLPSTPERAEALALALPFVYPGGSIGPVSEVRRMGPLPDSARDTARQSLDSARELLQAGEELRAQAAATIGVGYALLAALDGLGSISKSLQHIAHHLADPSFGCARGSPSAGGAALCFFGPRSVRTASAPADPGGHERSRPVCQNPRSEGIHADDLGSWNGAG